MARIANQYGESIFLNRYHIFGRDPIVSSTILNFETCSKFHAAIFYEGNEWYIEDQSINGLVINDTLIHKKKIPLRSIKKLRFCISAEDEWYVESLTPPCSYLQNLNNKAAVPLNQITKVKFNNRPFLLVKNGNWKLENREEIIPLSTGEQVSYKNERWTFVSNECLEDTVILPNFVPEFRVTFQLSENYESVNVIMNFGGSVSSLMGKSYNFIWYLLAKKACADRQQGNPETEIGWINNEELLAVMNRELKQNFDIYYFNLQIHRIRKQLLRLDTRYSFFFNTIIQRRKGETRMNISLVTLEGPKYEIFEKPLLQQNTV